MLIFNTHFLRIIINNTTMRLFVITLAALLGMATHMKAQSFTQHIQQHTKDTGTVTVVQSKDIDELVNSADVSGHKQVNPAKTANPSSPSKQTSPSATTAIQAMLPPTTSTSMATMLLPTTRKRNTPQGRTTIAPPQANKKPKQTYQPSTCARRFLFAAIRSTAIVCRCLLEATHETTA